MSFEIVYTFLPLCGKNPLTFMPQRVIFSLDGMPQSGKPHATSDNDNVSTAPGNPAGRIQMTAKKKAKELQNDLTDSAHKVWLAGLGAFAAAEEGGTKLFKSLVEKGEGIESKGKEQVVKAKGAVSGVKTVAESYWETFERRLDDRVTSIIHRLGVPTKDEIGTLTKKVEDLTAAIEKLRQADKPARTTTRKSTTKSASK
jgi:poly(hydroxyalkanoate) granule-associated protein